MKFTNDGNLDQNGRQIDFYPSSPERHSVFLNGTYDLTDNLTAFMQFNYSDINIDQTGGVPPAITVWQAPAIPRDGRALPDALNALLDSRANPDAPWPLFQVLAYNGNIRAENNNEVSAVPGRR